MIKELVTKRYFN